jgi:DNA-binding NarL/FixJ family response regulator
VYTWALDPRLVETAVARGAAGYLSKALPGARLADALERIAAGEVVISAAGSRTAAAGLDWPGRSEGLSERESEVLALITQGHSNADIARLMYLSINSIKSHIRSAYRKIGVATRTQAVLWGVDHGFKVDLRRIDLWG